MAETWTIKRCMDWTRDFLKDKGAERARFSAEWMLSSVTGMGRVELYMDIDRPLSPDELDLMHEYVVRRLHGEPLQYITGDTQFRTLQIACEPGVLIPRPETEVLVEEVLNFLDAEVIGAGEARPRRELPWNGEVAALQRAEREAAAQRRALEAAQAAEGSSFGSGGGGDGGSTEAAEADGPAGASEPAGEHALTGEAAASGGPVPANGPVGDGAPDVTAGPADPARVARVLEIGCGTGCISLSLVAERPGRVRCVATDIEAQAVALAMRNRAALGIDPADAVFLEGNLTTPVDPAERGSFDVLVSNPPYIPEAVMAELPDEVARFEPHRALVSGVDGLDLFRRILTCAPHMLRPGGLLACELFEGSLDAARSLCIAAGLEDVRIVHDLAGKPRIILARTPAARLGE